MKSIYIIVEERHQGETLVAELRITEQELLSYKNAPELLYDTYERCCKMIEQRIKENAAPSKLP